MDEIKLAFETIIVGLLAIPWVLILFYLADDLIIKESLLAKARKCLPNVRKSFALIGPLILGLAYCGGTILFPIADEYFNNPHNLPVYVRDDDAIRVDTLTKIYFDPEHSYYRFSKEDFPGLETASEVMKTSGPKAIEIPESTKLEVMNWNLYKHLKDPIHSIYNYQKYYDYNSKEGYEVLKPLQSRIIVLRGAVLNGLLLLGALSLLFIVSLTKAIRNGSKDTIQGPKGSNDRIQGLAIFVVGIMVWGLYPLWGWGTQHRSLLVGALSLLFLVALIEAIRKRSEQNIYCLVTFFLLGIIAWRGWEVPKSWVLVSALLVFIFVASQIILGRSQEAIRGRVMLLVIGLVWGLCWWGAWGVARAEDEYDKHVVGIFYGSRGRPPKQPEGRNPWQSPEK